MLLRAHAAAGLVLHLATISCTSTADTTSPRQTTLRMSRTTSRDLQGALSKLDNIGFQVVTEGGSSVTGLQNLHRGTIDVAMTMADVAYLAYAGQLDRSTAPFEELRGLAVISLNTLHLVVAKGGTISSIRDLKGTRVALGPVGSATELIAGLLLEAYGIKPGDVTSTRLPYVDTAAKLARGELDAAFMTQIPPSAAVTTAAGAGGRVLTIEGAVIEDLRTRYPYLKRTLIPALTYPGQLAPVRTVGVDLLLVGRADIDNDVVYRLLEAYFATRPGTQPEPDFERAPATPIPLHAGAARYYRQRELSR